MDGLSNLIYIANRCSQIGVEDIGKKKFQKLVYLIEGIGGAQLGYEYEIYFYGPYSRKLDDDLVGLSHDNFIEFVRKGQSHLIRPVVQTKTDTAPVEMCENEKRIIDEQLDRFGKKSPYELELFATTHYIASLLGDNADEESIGRAVKKVKGPKFSDEKISFAIREMELV